MTLRHVGVAAASVLVGFYLTAAVREGCATVDTAKRAAAAEGRKAAEAGLPPEACPYSPVSPEHQEWKRAWTAATLGKKTKAP